MDKKTKYLIIGLSAALVLVVAGLIAFFIYHNKVKEQQEIDRQNSAQVADLAKKEMENEYAQFALQYDELKTSVTNDSILTQLNHEQQRAQQLLAELKRTKTTDAAEIMRLKKELETVRSVLRTYIRQVDSLQRANHQLTSERDLYHAQVDEANQRNAALNSEKENLSQQVAIASQLDATGISLSPLKKNGKAASKTKDITRFTVSFNITRNVTAHAGNRTVYVRVTKPGNSVVNASGSFSYENRSIEFSAQKMVEYAGQETHVTVYVPVNEFLSPGGYSAYIFVDGQMIGSTSINIAK